MYLFRHLILMFALLFMTTSTTILFAKDYALEDHLIEKIDVEFMTQNPSVQWSKETIRHRMQTKEGNFFSQLNFDTDLKHLATDFDRVEPYVTVIDEKVHIVLKVWTKPLIRNIIFHGNCKIKTSKLAGELKINSCTPFDRIAFNKAFHTLKAYYVQKGFFEVDIDFHLEKIPETDEVDVHINIHEGRSGRIKNIIFRNFSNKERCDILNILVTKTYNVFLSWMSGEGNFNEDAMQHDRLQILNYLQNQGYADAQIDIQICEAKERNRINIIITADKGERYRFGHITFVGHTLYSDKEIQDLFLFAPGDPYSPEALMETSRAIMNFYGKCGYIDTVVNFVPVLSDCEKVYTVDFHIDEGDQYRVGLIKIIGNNVTKTKVILHETLLTPGEIFNLRKLQRTEDRLRNTGFFKNVNVYAVRSEGSCGLQGNFRDIHIEVEEDCTGSFNASLGFSTSDDAFGGLTLTEKNFDHTGLFCYSRKGMAGMRGGGEFLSINTSIGQKSNSYSLSWTQPYFRDTKWAVGFDTFYTTNQYISEHYDIATTGLTVHASYQSGTFSRVGYHYRINYTDITIHDVHGKKTQCNIEDVKKQKKKQEDASGIISAVGSHISYDSTNHPVEPTCGYRTRLEAELAGFGGKHYFAAISYLNTMYYPVATTDWIIKYRLDVRYLQPLYLSTYITLPMDEKLFLGGETMVRGFRPYALGPDFKSTKDPLGGLSLQYYSVEFLRPIFSMASVFVFADAGFLSADTWAFGTPNMSVGLGARVKIFGNAPPVTAGYGWPINYKDRSQIKRFFFQIGTKF